MWDIEVFVPDKVSITQLVKRGKPRTLEEGREGEIVYEKKLIRISLTGVWDLAIEDYDTFLDELIGAILHEYLHYYFYVNGIPQNEELIGRLSLDLQVLSLGHLIGATDSTEDVKAYERWVATHLAHTPKDS